MQLQNVLNYLKKLLLGMMFMMLQIMEIVLISLERSITKKKTLRKFSITMSLEKVKNIRIQKIVCS